MKKCTRCKEDFEIEKFPLINKNTGRRSAHCSECKREYDREHYAKNKVRRVSIKRKNAKNHRIRNADYVIKYLREHPCLECGEKDILVLEFDHRENKERNVTDMMRAGFSLERIQKEIDKCDVLCANCHKRRTAKQFNFYKSRV